MTNLLQPLDLTVNDYAKTFCRKRFNHWYMEQIIEQPYNGKQIEETDVKLQLTRLKPLHVESLVELFNHMTTSQGKEVIMSGWKASGIVDPFIDLDSLLTESPNNEECFDISELDEDQILPFATGMKKTKLMRRRKIYIIHLDDPRKFLPQNFLPFFDLTKLSKL